MTTATRLEELKPSQTVDTSGRVTPNEGVTLLTGKGFGTAGVHHLYLLWSLQFRGRTDSAQPHARVPIEKDTREA